MTRPGPGEAEPDDLGVDDDEADAALATLVEQLEASQWMPAAELRDRQFAALVALARHAADQSPGFGRRLADARLGPDDLGSPAGLARLPVLTRRQLQAGGEDLDCRQVPPEHEPVGSATTSGSSGEPVVVRRTAVNRAMRMATLARDYRWLGLDPGERMSMVRANAGELRVIPASPGRGGLPDTGVRQLIPITTPITEQAGLIADFAPVLLLTYPSSLQALLDHCQLAGVGLPSLRWIETIGETLHPATRRQATEQLGVAVWDLYSSQEVGHVAAQCPETERYHTMENLIVEVVDGDGRLCDPGAEGAVVITDLHNWATPLIRYDIGDRAVAGHPCPCGRGLPTLERILGRERNLLQLPDGNRHWPLVGFRRFREVAPVVQYQLVQTSLEHVEVRLVVERPLTGDEEGELGGVIQRALGHPFALSFDYRQGDLRRPGGKFEEFVCAITPPAAPGEPSPSVG